MNKLTNMLTLLFIVASAVSILASSINSLMVMGLVAFTALVVVATIVGVGVSMDVSGYNLSMTGNKEYTTNATRHSLLHAFWHSLFLALGIGLVTTFATGFQWLIVEYDLEWMFEWVTVIIPWLEPLQFPIWILAIIGVGLWIKLYRDKIRGEAEDEHLPDWLDWILKKLRVPVSQFQYVLVAVDMWFLTPLLKATIESFPLAGKILFVIIVFVTVFYCSILSIKYGQKIMQSKNQKVLATWMIMLVWAEPLITGYFAARATYWSFTGHMEDYIVFLFASGICVAILCHNKFTGIVEDKWEEASKAIASMGTESTANVVKT